MKRDLSSCSCLMMIVILHKDIIQLPNKIKIDIFSNPAEE